MTENWIGTRWLITIVVAVVLITLAACSSINSGRITGKEYEEAYTWFSNQCAGYNSKGVCTGYVLVPVYEPESWSFDLDNGEDTGWVYVDETTYNRYRVGDQYP